MMITSFFPSPLSPGIDTHASALVINYDFPTNFENYLHRAGRRGRLCGVRTCITFITEDERPRLRDLENYYATQIQELPVDISHFI